MLLLDIKVLTGLPTTLLVDKMYYDIYIYVVKQSERRRKQERENRMQEKTQLNFIRGLSIL